MIHFGLSLVYGTQEKSASLTLLNKTWFFGRSEEAGERGPYSQLPPHWPMPVADNHVHIHPPPLDGEDLEAGGYTSRRPGKRSKRPSKRRRLQ